MFLQHIHSSKIRHPRGGLQTVLQFFPICFRSDTDNRMINRHKTLPILRVLHLCIVLVCPNSRAAESPATAPSQPIFRPPSVPLVACDPYFSIWSPADKLTDADTVHWTGKAQRLACQAHIDGHAFRIMGLDPANVPALPQKQLEVLPTRTLYTFEGEGVRLTLSFMTLALPDDLMVYSRPVTYVTLEARAMDGKTHQVFATLQAAPEIAVNVPTQDVTWSTVPAWLADRGSNRFGRAAGPGEKGGRPPH